MPGPGPEGVFKTVQECYEKVSPTTLLRAQRSELSRLTGETYINQELVSQHALLVEYY